MAARIVSVSTSLILLETRERILRNEGYEVQSASSVQMAAEFLDKGSYDLVILGHTLSYDQRKALLQSVKLRSRCPVLELIISGQQPQADTISVEALSPDKFVETVKSILANEARTANAQP